MTRNQSQTLALAATKVAARAVEERLFREWFRNVWTIAAVPSDDSGPALLLAVDGDLRIVGADRVARTAFALDDANLANSASLSTNFDFDRSISVATANRMSRFASPAPAPMSSGMC
jgi:transcriptional regulator of acetoin/glycerol metabolism